MPLLVYSGDFVVWVSAVHRLPPAALRVWFFLCFGDGQRHYHMRLDRSLFRRMRLLPSHAPWDLSHASTSVACVLCHMELSELERMAWQGHGDPLLSPLRLLAPQGQKTQV